MSKVFRIYTGGNNTINDWAVSPIFPYNKNNRAMDKMRDPGGDNPSSEITSIPSPYARIDLVKNAFSEVVRLKDLDGTTIYHKMVSDALDVAEIFFNIEKYVNQGIVEVIVWNPFQAIQTLKNSGIEGHFNFADALEKYMVSDAKTYNFNIHDNIYILNYLRGEHELNIIGGTSPATLFFSSANDLQYIGKDIMFGQDKPFDEFYQPLYKRDFNFVKSLFLLRTQNQNFASLYPEVNDYLDLTFKMVKQQQKDELRNLTPADSITYKNITVSLNGQQNIVTVNSDKILGRGDVIIKNSDFEIKSTISNTQHVLVLPVDSGNRYQGLKYVSDLWGSSNSAPYKDKTKDYQMRILPNEGTKHPYLTVDDFLEDTLFAIPHGSNRKYLFDGNLNSSCDPKVKERTSFLLPIKDLFFQFFTLEDLIGVVGRNQQKMFEMEYLAGGGIRATLRIPIMNYSNSSEDFVEYTRTYYNGKHSNVDETHNEGALLKEELFKELNLLIMPCVRFSNSLDGMYRVFLMHDKSDSFKLDFYKSGNLITNTKCECRNVNGEYPISTDVYTIDNQTFDYIKLKAKGAEGLVVPIFKNNAENDSFSFSVDLGTTNTHVEFKKTNAPGECKPLVFNTIDDDDEMVASLFLPRTVEIDGRIIPSEFQRQTSIVERDIFPSVFDSNVDFHFPTRTMLSVAKTINWNNSINTFGLTNIAFSYCKRSNIAYNRNLEESIKWGITPENNKITKNFIDNLLFIIRNKVVLNNGKLGNTVLTWFYPASMSVSRRDRFSRAWNDACQKYFGPNVSIKCMTESEAPVNYFFAREGSATDMVTIDIGGGTTDIAFAKNREIQLLTSFRFAANSLFENPLAALSTSNGIIDYYKKQICSKIIGIDKQNEIRPIFDELAERPSEMASFMFGLKDNIYIKQNGLDNSGLDFLDLLQNDEDFKIVFILFYAAIIYHIAKIIKAKEYDYPRHLAFSGNGSRIISVLSPNSKTLASFTKIVLEKVVGKPMDKNLDIIGLNSQSSPKESTCKGGMFDSFVSNPSELIKVYMCGNGRLVTENDTYKSISPEYQGLVKKEVESFLNFVLVDLNDIFKYNDNFGLSTKALKLARSIALDPKNDIATYIERGIESRILDGDISDSIGETFFFYPIIGILSDITNIIYQNK